MSERLNTSRTELGKSTTMTGRTELINLRKEYGETIAVNDVNLKIESGELLVLLGPSGCGKTTTLRMIGGLETPTDGTILIDGKDETRTLPKNRGLSMVFQSYALYPHKTVRGNLMFPLQKMDLSDSERTRRVEEAADILEISNLLDKQPGQLSGGQRQRVAVGRTIVREPRIFLMDEPLSNLDAKLRIQTRSEIRDLQQQLGTTTVYVTHDQEEAMSIADRIAVMRNGTIEQVGTPQEIYTEPLNEFIADFVGDPSMNFIDIREDFASLSLSGYPSGASRAGIRPEHIRLAAETESSDMIRFSGSIEIVEPLGHSYEVKINTNIATLTALIETLPSDIISSRSVLFEFDSQEIHWFDSEGCAIESGGV